MNEGCEYLLNNSNLLRLNIYYYYNTNITTSCKFALTNESNLLILECNGYIGEEVIKKLEDNIQKLKNKILLLEEDILKEKRRK